MGEACAPPERFDGRAPAGYVRPRARISYKIVDALPKPGMIGAAQTAVLAG
jgi:hypothetical protein